MINSRNMCELERAKMNLVKVQNILHARLDATNEEKDAARKLLDDIGFYCAGTEFHHISNKVLEFFAKYPDKSVWNTKSKKNASRL